MSVRRRDVAVVLAASPTFGLATPALEPVVRATVRVQSGVVREAVPSGFLGFNLNSITLEHFHWRQAQAALDPVLVEGMRAFPGAYYRYPGGLISNHFAWEWAVGPTTARRRQKGAAWADPAVVRFGPREYFDFLGKVGGRGWYTVNLRGWSGTTLDAELPVEVVSASNGRLAALRAAEEPNGAPRYYHLGNELDRSVYEWPAQKLIERARASMAAIAQADRDARFVAFLRDFDWPNRTRPGVSRAEDFNAQLLSALPEVADASLQLYYDRPEESGANKFDITWRLSLVDRFLAQVNARRPGVRVWVTEHAKAKPHQVQDPALRLASTSGIDGAIASVDMCIGLLQRPAVQAAFWHALGGSAWWDLFRTVDGQLQPTPVYRAFRLLQETLGGSVLRSTVDVGSAVRYAGGYDVNAAVMAAPTGRTIWLINRAPTPASVVLADPALRGRAWDAEMRLLRATGRDESLAAQFAVEEERVAWSWTRQRDDRPAALTLPGRCIATVRLTPADKA